MELSLKQSDFLGSFDFIWSKSLDQYDKNKLNLFMLKINSNEFDYDLLVKMLSVLYKNNRNTFKIRNKKKEWINL